MAEQIGEIGAERHPTLLGDFFYDSSTKGTQTAGSKHDFDRKELESDEVAEIEYIEIFSPQVGGVAEDLKQVIPVLDGAAIEEYISLSGRYDSNMAPARLHQFCGPSPLQQTRAVFKFGETGIEDPFVNTTLKAKKTINMRTYAGASDVTSDYRIRVYGYIYKEDSELREVFGDTVYGAEATLVDYNRGVRLPVTKDEIKVEIDNWDSFVGGVKQTKPQILPLIRYAYNAVKTTANTAFDFNYEAGDVAETWENMYFDFGVGDALFIKGMGVRSPTHLERMGVKIGDREYPRTADTSDLFRVDRENNPLHFGHGEPLFPADLPLYVPIPILSLGYLIFNEKGRIIVYDDGTSVPADQIIAALQGIKVELP